MRINHLNRRSVRYEGYNCTVGIDLAMNLFLLHGVNEYRKVVVQKAGKARFLAGSVDDTHHAISEKWHLTADLCANAGLWQQLTTTTQTRKNHQDSVLF